MVAVMDTRIISKIPKMAIMDINLEEAVVDIHKEKQQAIQTYWLAVLKMELKGRLKPN